MPLAVHGSRVMSSPCTGEMTCMCDLNMVVIFISMTVMYSLINNSNLSHLTLVD